MSDSPIPIEDGSDQESFSYSNSQQSIGRLPNGTVPLLSDSHDVAVLREENCRLLTTLLDYKKTLENTKLRYGTMKKDYYAAKKRLKRLAFKLQNSGGVTTNNVDGGAGSESGESALNQQQTAGADDDIRKKWKEPNLKAGVKLKAAIGVHSYQALIKDGELQLPSLRTISRYVDALKKAGLKPNYDFGVRDSASVGQVFVEDEDSVDVDHNRNQHGKLSQSKESSNSPDTVNFTATPDVGYYRRRTDPEDMDEDEEDASEMALYMNGGGVSGDASNGGLYTPHPNQYTRHHQQQTLTSAHIEFLKSMTGFRKKWTPFELRTCMDIRRIIGSKEYDSLRKNDGMPLPSAKTLRKYKHTVHLDGVDVMSRKRSHREMVEGIVTVGNGTGVNGMSVYGDDGDDILNAEEPEGFFDINGLTEDQIDFLQSLSSNTKGFSDYELQKTLELKNELGGKNYEILRKQECLHIPTLVMLKKYEHDNGLEDLASMVIAEDLDDEDDQDAEQEREQDVKQEPEYECEAQLPDHFGLDMNGMGDDSHMGIFEHHSIFDRDDAPTFDMSKLSQQHMEFLNTLPENPKRWTPHMINSALDIKNEIGTRDYELLRRQGIPLPAARTLRRHKDIKSRVAEIEVA
ncbi:uncharacterized protein LOC129777502 [Toxorhynchites rutilus septentrionalis]|uniref:uncharacterized protein LOC129777502 n=1 Tax=Toxorhynchites rutilus septentrionalis TaxID=329112 RepID=UPI002479AE4C|nr:uncharacterized protein LOC129777502 [Toxorhynchites rutilus septentrionalis]XP_055639770.1 uncharacterized protein LOC129777502 [Toxorhynchites rutilus septentrionalis]